MEEGPIEAEPVLGNIKQNKKFKRFILRGIKKVKTEFGLIAIAHNLGKYALQSVKPILPLAKKPPQITSFETASFLFKST
ncbi:MAG: transposase [Ignavibacteria bacterium]